MVVLPSWLTADPGCRLAEFDFSGIEAVLTGWYSGDPQYIRLAKLGVHAYLTSHVAGEPADLRWSDADLGRHLAAMKAKYGADASNAGTAQNYYDPCKTVVHGRNYLRTAHGLHRDLPHLFPTIAAAEHYLAIYDAVCPKLGAWQARTLKTADERHMLGGAPHTQVALRDGTLSQGHPFAYTHWFWGVKSYKPLQDGQVKRYAEARKHRRRAPEVVFFHGRPFAVQLGDDAKRAAAFFPQSTAAAILFEALIALFSPDSPEYIGDAFYGRSPLRAPIHDSLLLEIPVRCWDAVVERVARVMRRPLAELEIPAAWTRDVPTLGTHLAIGVEAKASGTGLSWGEMKKFQLPELTEAEAATPLERVDPFGLVADAWTWTPSEVEWEEDVAALARPVRLAEIAVASREKVLA